MPIDQLDPRTLLLGLQPQARTPYDAPDLVAERRARVEQLREAAKAKQEAEYDNQVYDWAIKNNLGPDGTPDFDKVQKALYGVNARVGDKFAHARATALKSQLDSQKLQDDHEGATALAAAQLATGTTADNYTLRKPHLESLSGMKLPDQWDDQTAAMIQAIGDRGTSVPDQLKTKKEMRDDVLGGKFLSAMAKFVEAQPDLTDADVARQLDAMRHQQGMPLSDFQTVNNIPVTDKDGNHPLKQWAADYLHPTTPHEKVLEQQAKDALAQTTRGHDIAEGNLNIAAINSATQAANVASEIKTREQPKPGAGGAAAPSDAPFIDPNGPHGADFLKTIPKEAAMVQALAEGKQAWPTAFALGKPYWQDVMRKVMQYDPTFDTAQASNNARVKTRIDFTSGATSKNVNALNTAIKHVGTLATLGDKLGNTNYDFVNSVYNWITPGGTERGTTINNFNLAKQAVADELTRVYRQAGGNVEDIRGWQASINAAKSPGELSGAWQTIGQLLGGKLEEFQNQADRGLGTGKLQLLTPDSQKYLDRLTGGKSISGHYVGEKVTLKNGKTITISVVHPDGSFEGQ